MTLDPDIRFALGCFAQSQSVPARQVLAGLGLGSGADTSGLTGDGFPFELSFTSADDDLRWTCALAGHATAQDRMVVTSRVFEKLGGVVPCPLPVPHRFGAWLGGRHGTDGQTRYKLYLDPGFGPAPPDAPLGTGAVSGFRATLQMIGYGPDAGRREFYYRFQSAGSHLLRCLAARAGLQHRADDLFVILKRQAGHRPWDRTSIGVSYICQDGQIAPQITVFLFARSLWGSDAAIRPAFLNCLTKAGRNPDPYAAASAPLHVYRRSCTWHGMVALTLTETDHFWGIGLRPHRQSPPLPTKGYPHARSHRNAEPAKADCV